MKRIINFLLISVLGVINFVSATDYTQFVNPFIGTGGHGHTFPGACVPNGLVQLSPDTDTEGWDWISGYRHTDTSIMGFSHTHLSGTGCPDLGDILVMPRVGELITKTGTKEKPFPSMRSHIRFETQKASPGYYSVFLDNFGIKAEVTATEHCGYHHYTFPQSDSAHIVVVPSVGISLDGDNTGWSEINIINDSTIEGYRESFGWVPNQKVFFVMKFSKRFESTTTSFWGKANPEYRTSFGNWQKNGSVFGSVHFKTQKDEAVDVRVAISAVSIKNAYLNLNVEVPGWGFEKVVAAAKQKWNTILSKVEIDATPKQKEIFYTGIYHAYIQPNNIADVNGEYPTPDQKIGNR